MPPKFYHSYIWSFWLHYCWWELFSLPKLFRFYFLHQNVGTLHSVDEITSCWLNTALHSIRMQRPPGKTKWKWLLDIIKSLWKCHKIPRKSERKITLKQHFFLLYNPTKTFFFFIYLFSSLFPSIFAGDWTILVHQDMLQTNFFIWSWRRNWEGKEQRNEVRYYREQRVCLSFSWTQA